MNRRRFRSPHDVEGNCLMRVAAKAFHFEIAEPGVDRIAQRRRWLRRSLKAEHALVPRLDRRAGRLPCGLPSPAQPPPGSMRRRSSLSTSCPCERGCDGARWTGKPLQIAVDSVAQGHNRRRRRGQGLTARACDVRSSARKRTSGLAFSTWGGDNGSFALSLQSPPLDRATLPRARAVPKAARAFATKSKARGPE